MFDRTLIGEGIGTSKSAQRVPLHLHTPSPSTLPAPPRSQREEINKRNATRRAATARPSARPPAARPSARPPARPRAAIHARPYQSSIKGVSKIHQTFWYSFDVRGPTHGYIKNVAPVLYQKPRLIRLICFDVV